MARTGRPTKPTAIKALAGTLQPCRVNRYEPEPEGDLYAPPQHLTAAQRANWEYAIEHAPENMLKNMDISVLETWAVALAAARDAAKAMQGEPLTVMADSGVARVNPIVKAWDTASRLMLRCVAELGFSTASRPKVDAPKIDRSKSAIKASLTPIRKVG